jgi:phosphohistidine phosphatase SixA
MLSRAFVSVMLMCFACLGIAQPTQVIVVRHVERAQEPNDDPGLSPAGVARAELLADMLSAAKVRTIITTQYRRTQETAAPLAKRLGIVPTVLTIRRGELPAHIDELAKAVQKSTGAVLVVGHSNTVAEIVAAFSNSKPLKLCETTFSKVFVVTPSAPQLAPLQLKVGKSDEPAGAECQ